MQFKIFALLATIVVAQQAQAASLNFGNIMGDVSKIAVAGHEAIQKLENEIGALRPQNELIEPDTQNLLGDMADGLGDLANTITSLLVAKPKSFNLLGDAMGDMGDILGDLANALTHVSATLKVEPETRSAASSGASIIGEINGVSAKTIASAANAAAPYIKDINAGLGDLANTITNLNVRPHNFNAIGAILGGVADALGDLANALTRFNEQLYVKTESRSIASSGASIIGEMGNISAKEIASAANAAAPYIKKLNIALGDLANAITHV